MTTLVADVETDGLLPEMTRIWTLCIGDPHTGEIDEYADQPGYAPLAEGYVRLNAADRVVFHNGLGFDIWAINRLASKTLCFKQIWDTLVVSRLLDPETKRHALADWGVKLGHPKVKHDDWTRFSTEMVTRCREDVAITIKVFRRLWSAAKGWEEAVQLEHQVAYVIALQQQNGFRLDVPAANALVADLRQELSDIEGELQQLFHPIWVPQKTKGTALVTPKANRGNYVKGATYTRVVFQPFNPGSRQQIEARLRTAYDWKPTVYTASGSAKLSETVLTDIGILHPEVKPLVRYFRITKQLGQISDGDRGWLKLYRGEHPDARVHGSINTNGAVTGRMTHFYPNMGQVDKKDPAMRAVWLPRAGWLLVGCDASGIEMRMLAHYLARYDSGAYATSVVLGTRAEGTDPHSKAQQSISFHNRDNTKRATYAYFYGAGNKKLGAILIEDCDEAGVPRPKKSLTALGRTLRTKLEKGILGLDTLIEKVKAAHRSRGYLTGLDGRRVFTRYEHAALNTLLQSAGAVVMKKALVIFHFETEWLPPHGEGWGYCANVHDEVQIEASPELTEKIGARFAECVRIAGERLNLRCALEAEYDIGTSWKETH